MSGSGFALNLDLTSYFDDLRKYASVYVDGTKCKEVGDVENHIKTVFKLEDNICLTNKKFLIPRCESIYILQQYETLKVQKCDFYDHQIHKNKKSNPTLDHPALNLVQADRTIDLSCRPKQRLKINICQKHCILEAPLTPFESNRIRNTPQPSVTVGENGLDGYSETQPTSKHKIKPKKKKYDSQKDEEEINNDENPTNILDMSVKKLKKKNKEEILFAEENHHMNVDTPIDCVSQLECNQEISSEQKRKSRKRKKLIEAEETDLANSNWIFVEPHNESGSKQKAKTKNINQECHDGTVKDLSLTMSSDLEISDYNDNLNRHEERSVRKKAKSEKKSEFMNSFRYHKEVNSVDDTDNKTSSHSITKQNAGESSKTEITTLKNLKDTSTASHYKDGIEFKGTSLVNQVQVDQSSLLNSSTSTNNLTNNLTNNTDYNQVNESENISGEDESFKLFEEETKVKRKRVRKHKKRAKKERLQYLSAIGPVLNQIIPQLEKDNSQSSSDLAKHIFFTDEDFLEEMSIPKSPINKSKTVLQGNPDNENKNLPQDESTLDTSIPSDKNKTWQHDLMMLSNCTSKPLVFHRNVQPVISNKNAIAPKAFNEISNTSNENAQKIVSECNSVASMPEEVVICNGENVSCNSMEGHSKTAISSSNVSDSQEMKPDLKNVILTKYPVIDKVVPEDVILFKVLKLGESCEPQCSNTILAVVKSLTSFPEKISLQILDGFEECVPIARTSETGKDNILELGWSEIVEPRLFYP